MKTVVCKLKKETKQNRRIKTRSIPHVLQDKKKKKSLHYYCRAGTHIQMISKPICTSVLLVINMQLFDILSSETNHKKKKIE